jgi:hypothetical protein
MNYKIAIGFTAAELELTVEKLLRDGWKCQGGLVVEKTETKPVYMQAMTLN